MVKKKKKYLRELRKAFDRDDVPKTPLSEAKIELAFVEKQLGSKSAAEGSLKAAYEEAARLLGVYNKIGSHYKSLGHGSELLELSRLAQARAVTIEDYLSELDEINDRIAVLELLEDID